MTTRIAVTLTFDASIHQQIRSLLRKVFQSHTEAKDEQFNIKELTSGITNRLFKVELRNAQKQKEQTILVRVNGIGTEKIIDRKKEFVILEELSKQGKGPKLFAIFENGFVYEYFEGEPLDPKDFKHPKLMKMIAKKMAHFHETDLKSIDKKPVLFNQLRTFYKSVKDLKFNDSEKQRMFDELNVSRLEKEIDEMEELVGNCDVRFTHNDLLSQNIIYNEEKDVISFIDFEYSGYNYRAFDIGNHFNEFAGFEIDKSQFPDEKTQATFVRYYLEEVLQRTPTDEEVEKLRRETMIFSLLSSLYWGLWGIFQASCSIIDFNFLGYGITRIEWYFEWKSKVLENNL